MKLYFICVPVLLYVSLAIGRSCTVGEWASALSMCYHVVGFLYMVFSSVLPHHPLLGLQLYTLGDILSQNDQMVPEGMIVYSRARNVSKPNPILLFGAAVVVHQVQY